MSGTEHRLVVPVTLDREDVSAFVEYAIGCKASARVEGRLSAIRAFEDGRVEVVLDAAEIVLSDVKINGTQSLRTWQEFRRLHRSTQQKKEEEQ